jgi:hypothetical protein
MRQQLLTGQISQLGGIASLEDQARYRGLMDTVGANLSQPVGYNMSTGGFPSPSRYQPNVNLGGGIMTSTGTPLATNAPVNVDLRTGWAPAPDWAKAANRYGYGGGRPDASYNSGSQSNSYYDPNSGAFIDRTTGQITGYGSSGQMNIPPGQQGDLNPIGGGYA